MTPQAISINGDVTADDYAKKLIDGTLSKWGRVDVIVNNAGYTWDGVIHRMSDAQWDGIINCHATAPFKIIRQIYIRVRVTVGVRGMATTLFKKLTLSS